MNWNARETVAVFTVDLTKLDVLRDHNEDVARAIWAMTQIASDNRNAGQEDTTEVCPKSFRETYDAVVWKAFKEEDLNLSMDLADVLRAVHTYTYEQATLDTIKTTAEIPANHAMFILPYDVGLSDFAQRRNAGVDLADALETAECGLVSSFTHPETAGKLSEVFMVNRHRHRDDVVHGILRGSVVVNRDDTSKYALIEGGSITTFGSNGYDQEGITPQLV